MITDKQRSVLQQLRSCWKPEYTTPDISPDSTDKTDYQTYKRTPAYRELLNAKDASYGYSIPVGVAEHLSEKSIEVLHHFGLDAASLLNDYSCAIEDNLLDLIKALTRMRRRNAEHELKISRYEERLGIPKTLEDGWIWDAATEKWIRRPGFTSDGN